MLRPPPPTGPLPPDSQLISLPLHPGDELFPISALEDWEELLDALLPFTMSLIAKRTDEGVPVLYMPGNFRGRHFNRDEDDARENEAEKILNMIHLSYTNERKIKKAKERYSMSIHYFSMIFDYVDIYEVVNSCKSRSFNVIFIFYNLLHYAHSKTDVKLLNLLLEKISEAGLFHVSMIVPILEYFCEQGIYVNIPLEYAERLLCFYMHPPREDESEFRRNLFDKSDTKFVNYILDCITEVPFNVIVNIIFHDQIDILKRFHNKFKDYRLLYYAIRYESRNILDYLYSLEKPIGSYIDPEYLVSVGIDLNDVKVVDVLMAEGNLDIIEGLYDHVTDLTYLNNRIVLFISVRRNDYAMTEFLLSKGVVPDGISCGYAAYNGSLPMLELLIEYGADIKSTTIYYAAYSGKMQVLKYLYKKKYKFEYSTMNYLVEGGHLNINNLETLQDVVEPLQDHILNYACRDENTELEVIEYLYNKNAKLDPHVLNSIARWGSLEALRFFMSRGVKIDQHIMGNLATRGQLSIIRNLYRNVVPVVSITGQVGTTTITRFFNRNKQELNYDTVTKGIRYGCFEVQHSFVLSRNNNSLSILDQETVALLPNLEDQEESIVPTTDQLECVIYNQLPPVDEGTLQTAVRHRHLDLALFLMSKKAPVDEEALYDTIVRGFNDMSELVYNYYPVVNQYHIILAKLWNRDKILELFKDKPITVSSSIPHRDYIIVPYDYYNSTLEYRLYYACSHGELDVLKAYRGPVSIKIRSHIPGFSRYEHDHTDMLYVTVLHGQFKALRYLETRYNAEIKQNSRYTACAARIGRMDMLVYLVENGYAVCEKALLNASY